MEPTPAKPRRRRRRRWLIVAFVLGLVSPVSSWNWPRGDARFAGKWSVTPGGKSRPEYVWRLDSNGWGKFLRDDGLEWIFAWEVRDGALVVGSRTDRGAGLVASTLEDRFGIHFSSWMELGETSRDVIRISEREILLQYGVHLRRIPE